MNITTISAQAAQDHIATGAVWVDIREVDEFQREYIPEAIHAPLSQCQSGQCPESIPTGQTLIFYCQSGARTRIASRLLANLAAQRGCPACFVLEHGLQGWKRMGLPIAHTGSSTPRQPISLFRQIQIVAGALVLLGTVLGYLVSPYFFVLCGFIGAGLVFAGISGFCGLAILLSHMPWNRRAVSVRES